MWEENYELFLLRKLCSVRFFGINKHFEMAVLFNGGYFTMGQHHPRPIDVWDYLSKLYHFGKLDEFNGPSLVYFISLMDPLASPQK